MSNAKDCLLLCRQYSLRKLVLRKYTDYTIKNQFNSMNNKWPKLETGMMLQLEYLSNPTLTLGFSWNFILKWKLVKTNQVWFLGMEFCGQNRHSRHAPFVFLCFSNHHTEATIAPQVASEAARNKQIQDLALWCLCLINFNLDHAFLLVKLLWCRENRMFQVILSGTIRKRKFLVTFIFTFQVKGFNPSS